MSREWHDDEPCHDADCPDNALLQPEQALDSEDVEWVRWSHLASPTWIFGDSR